MALTFEWDLRKAAANLAKHDVAFEEAATVFADAMSLTIPDVEHSRREHRFGIIGKTFVDALFLGWGLFDFIEGAIDHHGLNIHHVVERLGQ